MEKYISKSRIHSIKELKRRKKTIDKELYDINRAISDEIKNFSTHHFIGSLINNDSVGTVSKFAFLAYNVKKAFKWIKHFKKPKK